MAKQKLKQWEKSLEKIEEFGVRGFDRETLKKVGYSMIREVKKRVRELEKQGLTDSPAYQEYVVNLKMKSSLSGKNINQIKHELLEGYNFLKAKTSTVKGAAEYNEWLDTHLGEETTKEEREKIWDIVHRAEKEFPERFINYGYDETIRRISKIAKETGFDKESMYDEFVKQVENSMNKAREENLQDRELDESSVSIWMKNSIDNW